MVNNKKSAIPNSGKGLFIRQSVKKNCLVSCFMGFQQSLRNASNYAFGSIDPCGEKNEEPFHWFIGHLINHKSGVDANVMIDKQGGIRLLCDIETDEELFAHINWSAYCYHCSREMKKIEDTGMKYCCYLHNCYNRELMRKCPFCVGVNLSEVHYDDYQIK